jgi:copper chaperone CopZ
MKGFCMKRFAVLLLIALFTTAWAGDVKKIDIAVEGMHCSDCTGKVKSALEKVKDVKSVEVNLKKGVAHVSLEATSEVNADLLAKAVSEAGFGASYQDGKETKTVVAVKTKSSSKDCDDEMMMSKEDCAKEGKSGCCADKAKAKTKPSIKKK